MAVYQIPSEAVELDVGDLQGAVDRLREEGLL